MTDTILVSITGIEARIFTLPGRDPFMLAADLAAAYETHVKRLSEAVSRNPDRFPEDFAFRLRKDEIEAKWSQFAATSQGQRTDINPLVFTHAGALALSGVLKTPAAARVSVVVHRAFADLERRALAQARFLVAKLRCDVLAKRPIYVRIAQAAEQGWDVDTLMRSTSYSRRRLEDAIREMVALNMLAGPLRGAQTRQPDLFDSGDIPAVNDPGAIVDYQAGTTPWADRA